MFFVKFYSVKKYIQQVQNQNTDVCKILGEKISTFCVLSIMQNCLSFSDALDQLKVIDFSKFLTKFCIFKSVGHRPSAWYRIVITPPTHPSLLFYQILQWASWWFHDLGEGHYMTGAGAQHDYRYTHQHCSASVELQLHQNIWYLDGHNKWWSWSYIGTTGETVSLCSIHSHYFMTYILGLLVLESHYDIHNRATCAWNNK